MSDLDDYLKSNALLIKNKSGLYIQKGLPTNSFQNNYVRLREKEKRLHSDDEVVGLPNISVSHTHFNEWQIRSQSTKKLTQYLKIKPVTNVLEIGCGNGWLSNHISMTLGVQVCGIDVNEFELEQACRVFKNENVFYLQADVFADVLPIHFFDAVIFASSFQYFPDAKKILQRAAQLLTPSGKIHLIDTPFYSKSEQMAAQQRSETYFTQLGFSKMAQHYFHHLIEDLDGFNWTYLYNPRTIKNKILKKFRLTSPFPWIVVRMK